MPVATHAMHARHATRIDRKWENGRGTELRPGHFEGVPPFGFEAGAGDAAGVGAGVAAGFESPAGFAVESPAGFDDDAPLSALAEALYPALR